MAKGRNKKGQFVKGNEWEFEEGNKCAEKWSEEEAIKLGDELLEWMKASNTRIYFKEFFAIEKGIYPAICKRLIERFTAFAYRIEMAKEIQEVRIAGGCLTNELNSSMGKFLLSANHGMSEKSITEVEQKGEAPTIKLEIIEDNRK